MSAPIGPGDWVECVDVGPHPDGSMFTGSIELGSIYRVFDCGKSLHPKWRHVDVLFLWPPRTPMPSGRVHGGYGLHRFRPIYRPKSEIIEALKAPPKHAPVRTVEPA